MHDTCRRKIWGVVRGDRCLRTHGTHTATNMP
jgi:hypothetical protein